MGVSTVALRLPAVPGSARQARDAVLGLPELEDDSLERGRIVVGELFTSCLQDAKLDPADVIEVTLSVHDGCLSGEVTGRGGLDLVSAFSHREPQEDEGRGLRIVDRLVDQWGVVVDGTTRVWFEIDPHVD